jgi:hypothetical protein
MGTTVTRPEYASSVRQEFNKWYQPDLVEHWIEGLRKARLEIPDEDARSPATASGSAVVSAAGATATPASGTTRAGEGFWVAVLPFKYAGNVAESPNGTLLSGRRIDQDAK